MSRKVRELAAKVEKMSTGDLFRLAAGLCDRGELSMARIIGQRGLDALMLHSLLNPKADSPADTGQEPRG